MCTEIPGYGITGPTSEQYWRVFPGSGGNRKTLLVHLLEKSLEEEGRETGREINLSVRLSL